MVSEKEFTQMLENLSTLVDFLNDFCSLENPRFQKFIFNCVLSFIVSDTLNLYLLNQKNVDQKHGQFLLLLILFIDKLKNEELKKLIAQYIFSRKVSKLQTELFHGNIETLIPIMDKYLDQSGLNVKSALIANQLVQVYEKHLNLKFESVSSTSFNDLLRSNFEITGKGTPSEEKQFHRTISQRTGIISYIPWSKELHLYAINDPIGILDSDDNGIDNQLRNLLLIQINVILLVERSKKSASIAIINSSFNTSMSK